MKKVLGMVKGKHRCCHCKKWKKEDEIVYALNRITGKFNWVCQNCIAKE